MRRTLLIVAVLIAGLAGGCSGGDPGPGEARLTVDGRAELRRRGPDEKWVEVSGSPLLRDGDSVRVLSGTAGLEGASGVGYELRRDTEIRFGETVEMKNGTVLAKATAKPARVNTSSTVVSVTSGAARITRDLAVAVSAYSGSATVTSAGRRLVVPALREVGIAATGLVPTAADPLDYDADDEWDRRYLGAAMSLGDELDARSRGFSTQLVGGESVPDVLLRALPALAVGPLVPEVRALDLAAGESLVGAAITLSSRGEASPELWSKVFGFRQAGAAWGLVALDQQTDDGRLLDLLDGAETRAPLTIAAAGGDRSPAGGPATSSTPPPTTPGRGPTTPTTPTTPTAPSTPPPTSPEPPLPPGPTLPVPAPPLEPGTPPPPAGAPDSNEPSGPLASVGDLLDSLFG